MEVARRTVILQKEGRILPIDHLVDATSGGGETTFLQRLTYIDRPGSSNGCFWAVQTHDRPGNEPTANRHHGSESISAALEYERLTRQRTREART